MTHNDAVRRRYLEAILVLLEGPRRPEILDKACLLVDRWQSAATASPWYIERWRRLLGLPVSELRAALFAGTDEAEALRHCMPFAGVLSNRERTELRQPQR